MVFISTSPLLSVLRGINMELSKINTGLDALSTDALKKAVFTISVLTLVFFVLRGFSGGFRLVNTADALYFLFSTVLLVYLRKELENRDFTGRENVIKTVSVIEYISILTVFSGVGVLAQYGAVWNRPLILNDSLFIRLDSLFGFNWFAFNGFIVSHDFLKDAAGIFYGLINISTILIIALLVFRGKEDAALRFMMFMTVTLALAVVFFHFYPLVGPVKNGSGIKAIIDPYYQPSIMAASAGKGSYVIGAQSLDGMRVMQTKGTYAVRGAICFPSYHAVLAFGYMYFSKYLSKALHGIFVTVSLLMCIAAMPAGNHFLVDILAGWALALCGIFLIPQNADFLMKAVR